MALSLLIGGARSGKSSLAVRRAREWPGEVAFIATGEAGDAEMAERIERHRAERDPAWVVIEEPLELADALGSLPEDAFAIVDCLSLWVANLLGRGDDAAAVERLATAAVQIASARAGPTVVITNEVGMGVVPASPAGRGYRDLLGRVNAIWAGRADEVALVVAGRMLALEASGGD